MRLTLPNNPNRSPQLFLSFVSFLNLLWLILFIEPQFVAHLIFPNSFFPFFCLVLLTLFWGLSGFTGRWKQSLLWSLSLTGFLWLHMSQLDNWLTLILLLAFNIVWGYYWHLSYETIQK